MDSLGSTVQ